MDALLVVALISPLVALIVAAIAYARFCVVPGQAIPRPVMPYVLWVLAFGLVLGFVGNFIGIAAFCSGLAAAQCGLGGILIAAPIGFSIGVAIYVFSWVKVETAP